MKKNLQPPKLPLRFFRWFCHPDFREDIEGDLFERFEERVKRTGIKKAKWLFVLDILLLFRSGLIRGLSGNHRLNHYGMFKNYLTVAFRIFKREKAFTFINVIGLALGITCSLSIYLWVHDELKYNQFIQNDRVCYVHARFFDSGNIHQGWSTPYSLQKVLQEKYSVIEKAASVRWTNPILWKKAEDNIEIYGVFASPEIFEVFEFSFLQGGFRPLFDQPESIVISETFASRYYGPEWNEKPIVGEILTNKEGENFKVVGVIRDLPEHSTLELDFVIPYQQLLKSRPWLAQWGNYSNPMYVRISDNVSIEEANNAIANAIVDNRPDEPTTEEIFLQPFRSLYLYNNYENGQVAGGRIEYIRILSMAAILILVIASINFMNLSIARSSRRIKETGIRKVLGALKTGLRYQVLTESILIALFGLIVSVLFTLLLIPQLNELTGKSITLDLTNPLVYIVPLLFALILGTMSGLYPAFYISSFNTVKSIKGAIPQNHRNSLASKGLVIFQFMVTIFMITATITVYQQISYIQSKNIGLDRVNLIKTYMYDMDPMTDFKLYRNKLLQMPGIAGVTATSTTLLNVTNSTSDPIWTDKGEDEQISFDIVITDPDFLPVTKISLKEGRNFDPNIRSDTSSLIINEVAARVMRMENPIGQTIEFWEGKGKVIGVINDFHNHSLHSSIKPTIIVNYPEDTYLIYIRSKPGETSEALASMQTVHEEFSPERTLYYNFVDDLFNEQYKTELVVKDLALYFTILATVISSLGLLGLVAYSTNRRTKEIGIRKVLGATLLNILRLLSTEFMRLVLVAIGIALPLAYHLMGNWLQNFEFRIELSWWLFVLAAIFTIILSLVTLGSQALKAALANPVNSLRNE